MSVMGASPGPVNGTGPLSANLHETQEYEKILKLRDQIFSGEHPRLKVPKHVVRKLTPRTAQSPTVPAPAASIEQPKVHPLSSSTLQEQSPGSSVVPTPPATAAVTSSGSAGSHVGVTKPTSEIDPIFLTKSDDLIRAEIQLQRERVERALRNQFEQKRIEYRTKTSLQESQPEFDVADVLAKALEIVKPASIPDVEGPNVNAAASDSFDENSFYSSKAPDSPQHGDHHEHSPIQEHRMQEHRMRLTDVDQPYGGSHVDRRNMEGQQYRAGHRNQVDLDMQASPYNIADRRGPLSRSPENLPYAPPSPSHYRPREPDMYDEPEYSPPGPELPPNDRREEGEYEPEPEPSYRMRSNGKPAGRGYEPRRNVSPLRDGRVVRNHITSPAAPQPSRVSPLAVNKVASLPQSRQARQHRYHDAGPPSGRASPEGTLQPLTSRKRRRVQEASERPGADDERMVASPGMPYIKPEPLSPPPFSDLPTHGPIRRAHTYDRSALIDVDSPRHSPVPRGMVYEDRYGRRYDAPVQADYGIPRSASRIAYRRPARDDQDLRRVVSMQHVRQPEYAHDYPETPMNYPRAARAASYVVPDRPPQADRSRYYEEPTHAYGRRYIPQEIEPTSPRLRESYAELEPEPRVMGPPPPRRVVVDAEGNRYIESVPASKMPPPPSRSSRVDPYYEEPYLYNGSMRAASVMEDPYRERRYVQDMPPPPPVAYRRAPEYAERPYYEREIDEHGLPLRAGSVAVASYPRQATYVEEAPMPRMSSVRPAPVSSARYEEPPREPVQRLHSVRPDGRREVSIFVDDEQAQQVQPARQRREYAHGYGSVRPAPMREERFYDEDEPSKFGMDGMHEMVQRVPRRY